MGSIRKRGDYQFNVQINRKNGAIKESKTFNTRKEAEAWERKIESEIDRGVYVSKAEAEATTFGEACDRYEREVLPRLKGAAQDKSRIKVVKSKIEAMKLAAITSSTLAKYRDDRIDEVSSQTVIHELGLIHRVLKMCVIDWGIALPAGVPQVRKPTKPEGRSRRVEDSEINALCVSSESAELNLIITLAMETAMRRGEIAKLKRENIDYKIPCLNLSDTKNGSSRQVPLSRRALALLKNTPARIDGMVFGMKPDSITRAFDRALKRARKQYALERKAKGLDVDKLFLANFRFHDLRHEATSRIADKVDNLIELASITGHKDMQMLKRYYHPKASDLAKKLG